MKIVILGMLLGHVTVIVVLILGDSKVVVNWMNGDWEVKGSEHILHVRNVIDQFVRWYLGGIFRPRNDESCWCRHVFA